MEGALLLVGRIRQNAHDSFPWDTLLGSLPALVGIAHASLTPAAAASMHALRPPLGFPNGAHAVFGFGAVGATEAERRSNP